MHRLAMTGTVLVLTLSACSSMFGSERSTPVEYAGSSVPVMNETQITRDLQDHGYSNISNLHKSGNDWVGSAASKSGQSVDFDVDEHGVIHTK